MNKKIQDLKSLVKNVEAASRFNKVYKGNCARCGGWAEVRKHEYEDPYTGVISFHFLCEKCIAKLAYRVSVQGDLAGIQLGIQSDPMQVRAVPKPTRVDKKKK